MMKDKWYWWILYLFGSRCHQPYSNSGFWCYHKIGNRCLKNNIDCDYKTKL